MNKKIINSDVMNYDIVIPVNSKDILNLLKNKTIIEKNIMINHMIIITNNINTLKILSNQI